MFATLVPVSTDCQDGFNGSFIRESNFALSECIF